MIAYRRNPVYLRYVISIAYQICLSAITVNGTDDHIFIFIIIVLKRYKFIDNICEPKKVPVIAGEEGICSGCGIATLCISYYDLGYTTGKMAVKILRDGGDISTMPIEYAADPTPKYNKQNCEALGITPLEGYTAIEVK